MIRTRVSKKIVLLLAGDVFLLYAALWATLAIRYMPEDRASLFQLHLFPFTLIFSLWLALVAGFGLYELRILKNSRIFLYRLIQTMTINTILAIVVFYFFPFAIEPRRNLLLIAGIGTALFFSWRWIFNMIVPRAPAARVMFLGISRETIDLADYLTLNPQLGWRPVAFVSHGESVQPTLPSLPSLPHFVLGPEGLSHLVRDFKPQAIIISPEMKNNAEVVAALFKIIGLGLHTYDFAAFHEMLTGKIPLSLIREAWFLENLIGIKKYSYDAGKRITDILLAALLSLPTLALTPFIAAALKINSRGPIFFRQKRIGKNGAVFEILKFRSTWRTAVPEHLGWNKAEDASAYTPVGALLRKTYLDELPQLINIFKGEMSFVGPRPERPEFVQRLARETPFYEMRLLVPPGITGWAQINMENDASPEDAPEKMQYDLYYVKNRSFMLDLLIMLRTTFTLLQRQGR